MRPYTQPNFDTDTEVLRSQIESDYDEMAKNLALPEHLDFTHARKAVFAGGLGMNDGSPYETFRNELLRIADSTGGSENETQDVLEVLTGVWNHFPHSDLDNLSPIEKMRIEQTAPDTIPSNASPSNTEEHVAEIDSIVLSFSNVVAGNLLHYLKSVGLGKKEQQHVLDILSDPSEEPNAALLYFFTQITDKKRPKQKTLTIDDMQLVARAIMWCENYTALKMPNGHWNSRMLQSIAEQSIGHIASSVEKVGSEAQSNKEIALILDPLQALQALSLVHDAISDFSEEFNADIGIEEATRHLTDWLALRDVRELLAREDLNITALHFFEAARRIAVTGDPKRPYKRLATHLRKEIAPDSEPAAFDSEAKRIAEKVLNLAQDPVMLMPYPGKEPGNCVERLEELAPDLKFRSTINDDFSSIPSPFFP